MPHGWMKRILKRTLLPWLVRNGVSRRDVIQRCIDSRQARTYLEIGVSDGRSFSSIQAPTRIGVDPIPPAQRVLEVLRDPGVVYVARTSDSFFETEAPRLLANGVDVVFIDGLHTWAQAYRDCVNSLQYLTPDGVILLHDCLPRNEGQAMVASSPAEAAELAEAAGIPFDWAWTGDVWKAIVALRQHPDLATFVLHCDRGVGVVRRGPNEGGPRLSEPEIAKLRFADLAAGAEELLGLRKPYHLGKALASR
jgi:hypothetical protein